MMGLFVFLFIECVIAGISVPGACIADMGKIYGFNFPECEKGHEDIAYPNPFNTSFLAWDDGVDKVVVCLRCFDHETSGGLVTQVTSAFSENLCSLSTSWRDLSTPGCVTGLGVSGAKLLPASVLYVGRSGTAPPLPFSTVAPTEVITTTADATATSHAQTTSPPTPGYLLGPCDFDRFKCASFLQPNCAESVQEPFVFDGTSRCGNNVCMRCFTLNGVQIRTEVVGRPCGQCDTANPAFWQPIEFSCGNLDNANFAGPVSLRCDLLNLTTTSRVTSTTRTSTSTIVSTTTLTTTTPPERTSQQNNPSTTRPVEVVTYDAGVCPSDRRRCSVLLSADCRETLPEPFVLDGDRCGNFVCARCAYVNNIPRQTEIAASSCSACDLLSDDEWRPIVNQCQNLAFSRPLSVFCSPVTTVIPATTVPPPVSTRSVETSVPVVPATTTAAVGTTAPASFLSGAEAFGIAVAVLVLLGLVILIVALVVRRQRKQHRAEVAAPVDMDDMDAPAQAKGDGETPEDFL